MSSPIHESDTDDADFCEFVQQFAHAYRQMEEFEAWREESYKNLKKEYDKCKRINGKPDP